MSIFRFKARTADSWLAGIGASGALMGSAFVTLVILVGVVSFNSWPRPGQLFSGNGGNIAIDDVTVPSLTPPSSAAPNLVAIFGATATAVNASHVGSTARPVSRPNPGPNGGAGPGPVPPDGNGGTVTGPPRPSQPPTESSGGNNAVSRAVSGIGNNVESDTNSLGEGLGGNSSPGAGGLVGGVGRTLNDALQTLAGNR